MKNFDGQININLWPHIKTHCISLLLILLNFSVLNPYFRKFHQRSKVCLKIEHNTIINSKLELVIKQSSFLLFTKFFVYEYILLKYWKSCGFNFSTDKQTTNKINVKDFNSAKIFIFFFKLRIFHFYHFPIFFCIMLFRKIKVS